MSLNRKLCGPMGAATMALACIAQSGYAQDARDEAFNTLVELCSRLPAERDQVESKLVAGGWAEPSDPVVLFDLMASGTFNFKHSFSDRETLGKSLENAFFMAASILGNSALPPAQKAYVSGDLVVGVIGLTIDEPGLPYCIIGSSHDEIGRLSEIVPLEAAEPPAHGFLREPEGLVHSGSIGASSVKATYVDPKSVLDAIEQLGVTELPYSKRLTPIEAAARLTPFVAVIAPTVPTGRN